jgi:hypothetical protein
MEAPSGIYCRYFPNLPLRIHILLFIDLCAPGPVLL